MKIEDLSQQPPVAFCMLEKRKKVGPGEGYIEILERPGLFWRKARSVFD